MVGRQHSLRKAQRPQADAQNGPRIALHAGRHYARYLAAGTAGIYAGNVQPMRIVGQEVDSVRIELNHPLARCPLTVAVPIIRRTGFAEEHGGRCNDIVMDVLAAGAGLETFIQPVKPISFPGNRSRASMHAVTRNSTRSRAWSRISMPWPVHRSGICMAADRSRVCRYWA